jgi:hypothetical protein
MAHYEGLGAGKHDEIEIVGDTDAANERWNFTVGDNLASCAGDVCWFGPLKPYQVLFFRTPIVYAFILGSFLYHDFYWWPVKGVPIFEKWKKESQWGRLFEGY